MEARAHLSSPCSAEALQHVVSMVLSAEEHCQNSDRLLCFIDFEVEYGAVLRNASHGRPQIRQERPLMRCVRNRVDFRFDRSRPCRSALYRIGKRFAQGDIGIDQVSYDQPEIAVTLERPYDLKGHRIFSSRQLCLRDAGDFLLDLEIRLPFFRRSGPSAQPARLLSLQSDHGEVQAPAELPRSRSKTVRPRPASLRRRPAVWKSKRMSSHSYRVTPSASRNYHSVAPTSICGGAP